MNTPDSHETIFPADPRVTAYAFGELEGDEFKLVEAAVAADPALQAAVSELRAFGDNLSMTLLREPLPPVDGGPAPADPGVPAAVGKGLGGLLAKLPAYYYLAGGMAAAGFAVLVAVRSGNESAVAGKKEAPVIMELVAGTPNATKADRAAPAAVPKDADAASVVFDQKLALSPGVPLSERPVSLGVGAGRAQANGIAGGQALAADAAPGLSVEGQVFGVAGKDADTRKRRLSPEAKQAPDYVARDVAPAAMPAAKAAGAAMNAEVSLAWSAPSGYAARAQPAADEYADSGAEAYAHPGDSAFRSAAAEPLSTFSIDVDTASYSNIRRFIMGGRLPPRDAVRIEELVNYFPYRYAPPARSVARNAAPFAAHLEVASAPWAPAHRLVRVGIKGREFGAEERPSANLVFLLDVSGSMNAANKLPLVKESLRLLVDRLRPDDRVAIVTYAGSSGLALPSTPVAKRADILGALDNLEASGSTNGAMGIHLAYDIAKANSVAGGVNRVILCTDGDFNVGVTDRAELTRLVAEKAKARVFLSVFGFGMGNLKDATLESLADKGDGAYGYIDTRREAEKVFVEQAEGTLATIAKDVKIQVEFNPARVASYRLIGYENRLLAKEDFNNDAVDAGEIGAGHTVTALYEIVPAGTGDGDSPRPLVDPLKYGKPAAAAKKPAPSASAELLTVKVRYKQPEGDVSAKQEFPLTDGGADFAQASEDFRFAAAVASWGMLLRDSPNKGSATYDRVLGWAGGALGEDAGGHRAEFVRLVRRAAESGAR